MKKIVIVDSDPGIRATLLEKLSAANVEVRAVSSASEAYEKLQRGGVDLVISALEMPRPNGLDILRYVRGMSPQPPVILLSKTHVHDESHAGKLLEEGAAAVLMKPIVINDLYEAVERATGAKIEGRERRRYPRIPIRLEMSLDMEGTKKRVVKKSWTVDISLGGLSFENQPCEECCGRSMSTIHPDCPLYRHALDNDKANDVVFKIYPYVSSGNTWRVPASADFISAKGRLVHVMKTDTSDTEYVGVKFTDFDSSEKDRLKDHLRDLANDLREMTK